MCIRLRNARMRLSKDEGLTLFIMFRCFVTFCCNAICRLNYPKRGFSSTFISTRRRLCSNILSTCSYYD